MLSIGKLLLGGLARNGLVGKSGRPDMTSAVNRGRETLSHTNSNNTKV